MTLDYNLIKAAHKVALTDSMTTLELGYFWRHQVILMINCNSYKAANKKRFYGFKRGCYLQINSMTKSLDKVARYGGSLELQSHSYRALIKSIKLCIENNIGIRKESREFLDKPLKEDVDYLLSLVD